MEDLADVCIHYVKPFNTATFKARFTDTSLLQTVFFILGKRKPLHFL